MSETTETSARLRWERPEPPAPYSYDLTVTSAHDRSPVLKLNLTATEHVARGLRAGHTYHVAVVCHLRSQVRATYQGSFSTSEYAVGFRQVGTRSARGTSAGRGGNGPSPAALFWRDREARSRS